jgi:hypothetical protein
MIFRMQDNKNQGTRFKTQDTRFKEQEVRIKTKAERIKTILYAALNTCALFPAL